MAGIYKSYDIRGIVPDELDDGIARKIGYATARRIGAKRMAVGRDARASSPSLSAALIEGIRLAGCEVVDVGMLDTPGLYFAVGHLGLDGGIMVSASHNPARYNGFKICREQAIPLSYETGIGEVEAAVAGMERVPPDGARGAGAPLPVLIRKDVLPDYVEHLLTFAKALKPLTIVCDAGNGMGGMILERLARRLPGRLVPLYWEPDCTFPNHEANPLDPKTLEDLKRRVAAERADLGAAFDGDADRCAFVTREGEKVPCDLVTALLCETMLEEQPGGAVVYDLRSSRAVPEEIRKHGGVPVRDRVGHAHMKATLRRHDGPFGGELSGHYYFKRNFFADSGMIAFLQVWNVLSASGKTLADLMKPLLRYHATGEVNFRVKDAKALTEELARRYGDGRQDRLDGLTVEYVDWWFNLRASNTEPLLRLNLEADTRETMERRLREVLDVLGEPAGR